MIKAKTNTHIYWWRVKGREGSGCGSGSNYGMLSAKLMNMTHQPQALWVACIEDFMAIIVVLLLQNQHND